jgi:hydroxymethylbilane synthase
MKHQVNMIIRIGTRRSALALKQTELVVEAIHSRFPEVTCEIVKLETKGDRILEKPLTQIGGKAVFVTEIEQELLAGNIDIAVHSGKDLPAQLEKGLCIQGVLPRENPADVLVVRKGENAMEKEHFLVGTGSPRRQMQIQKMYPNAVCRGLRGNVPTRLDKLAQGKYDGIILAMAGLKRLGLLEDKRFEFVPLSTTEFIPAACQGIIAIEGRCEDTVYEIIKAVEDRETRQQFDLERAMLCKLGADCHAAVGVFAYEEAGQYYMDVMTEVNGTIKIDRKLRYHGK